MIRSDQIQAEFFLGKQPGTRLYGGEQENSLSCLIPAVLALLWSRVYKGQTGFEFLGASFSRFRVLRFRDLGVFVFEIWVLRASVFVFETTVRAKFEFRCESFQNSKLNAIHFANKLMIGCS